MESDDEIEPMDISHGSPRSPINFPQSSVGIQTGVHTSFKGAGFLTQAVGRMKKLSTSSSVSDPMEVRNYTSTEKDKDFQSGDILSESTTDVDEGGGRLRHTVGPKEIPRTPVKCLNKSMRPLNTPSKSKKYEPPPKGKQKLSHSNKSKCYRSIKCLFIINAFLAVICGVMVYHTLFSTPNYIQDLDRLKERLHANVLGQHIALDIVTDAFDRLFSENNEGKHILLMSSHGWTGVGKNFVSRYIINTFWIRKVVKFIIPLHFPHESKEEVYKNDIHQWILSNVTENRVNIFLLDEMDKAHKGVIVGLKAAVKHLKYSYEYSNQTYIIFLFLSNSKGSAINKIFLQEINNGKRREELIAKPFLEAIQTDHDKMWYYDLLSENLIDEFVPFLPLERHHILQCIERDMVEKGLSVDENVVEEVAAELTFIGEVHLSVTGCKRVADKVDLVVHE